MSLKKGDTVYLECWSPQKGYYVKLCKVVDKSGTTATLRPEKKMYVGGNEVPIHPSNQEVIEQSLDHVEQPIEHRLNQMKKFAEWFIEHMSQLE